MTGLEEKPDRLPEGLAALMERAGKPYRRPPVERWNPEYCGDLDIRIAADGTWYYLGSPIGRARLVRLFASVLRHEHGRYYLVTPVEKIGIRVDDAPFVAVELHHSGRGRDGVLTLRTNIGDVVEVDEEHRLRFAVEEETGGLKPYVMVRDGLEALLARPLLYELADLGLVEKGEDGDRFGVWSRGTFFAMERRGAEVEG